MMPYTSSLFLFICLLLDLISFLFPPFHSKKDALLEVSYSMFCRYVKINFTVVCMMGVGACMVQFTVEVREQLPGVEFRLLSTGHWAYRASTFTYSTISLAC